MQFHRYWARGESTVNGPQGSGTFHACGHSDISLEDALRDARERAASIGQRVMLGESLDASRQYYADGRPLKEEIIEELQEEGQTVAIISRNSYGCLVLNTTSIFFADIDQPRKSESSEPPPIVDKLLGFLKKQKVLEPLVENLGLESPQNFEQNLVEKIEDLVRHDSSLLIRLYRTKHGYRAVMLNEQIPCNQARSSKLLDWLGSDQLYVALCRSQDCYRARLTPKPWRCGYHQPPQKFPFQDSQRGQFEDWLRQYESISKEYATCALIGDFGSGTVDPLAEKIIQVHDMHALNGTAPLA